MRKHQLRTCTCNWILKFITPSPRVISDLRVVSWDLFFIWKSRAIMSHELGFLKAPKYVEHCSERTLVRNPWDGSYISGELVFSQCRFASVWVSSDGSSSIQRLLCVCCAGNVVVSGKHRAQLCQTSHPSEEDSRNMVVQRWQRRWAGEWPQGTWRCLETFSGFHSWGSGECYWYLTRTFYNLPEPHLPTQPKNSWTLNVSMAQVEKLL